MPILESVLAALLVALAQAAPYVVLGYLIAALVREFVSVEALTAGFGRDGLGPVARAVSVGALLPICSCGVIPLGVGLVRGGAAVGTTLAFMFAAPDAAGRRLRAETAAVTSSSTIVTVDFAYDGLRCLEERTTGGPRDGEVREYVHGAGLDEILVTHVSGPSGARVYYHHEDVTGSTVALTDGSGTLVDEVAYDEWGVPYFRDAAAHAEAGNQHLFQGHRFDEETGLYYLRARYYDPAKGRFLQRDPMGVWGDPLNLGNPYTFAADNPVTRGDPLGLLTTIQLERGSSSAAEEITKIRAARAAHGGSWKFQIGLTFSDPDYMRGVAREKELLGQSDDFLRQVNGVANSWQMDAGLMALSMMPGGGFMVDWTFRLHEYARPATSTPSSAA